MHHVVYIYIIYFLCNTAAKTVPSYCLLFLYFKLDVLQTNVQHVLTPLYTFLNTISLNQQHLSVYSLQQGRKERERDASKNSSWEKLTYGNNSLRLWN